MSAAPILRSYLGTQPRIDASAWIAPGAVVVGDVEIGAESSVWYGCVLRGDVHRIRVGRSTNIQDGSILHVTAGRYACEIGDEVTIGHRAVVHGCRVEDRVLIGIGAVVLDGALLRSGSLVAAGTLIPPGFDLPADRVAMGVPAKVVRPLRDEERALLRETPRAYALRAREHAESVAVDTRR
jgi:carbonic anhydrase/acetyltransferase-like protein (isoleucine patch superfamily)